MNQALVATLKHGIATLSSLPNENAATVALASALHASGARRFWTAKTIWQPLVGATCSTSWKGSKAYDLSWAMNKAAKSPEHLLQVKLGNKTQEDQEVLLFLGDVAFAALDHSPAHKSIMGVAVIPANRHTTYWSKLVPTTGTQMSLVLDPAAATNVVARGTAWINPTNGRITPSAKSQYSKIFGAGTNAKFVGLFQRKGKVTVAFDVCQVTAGAFNLLVYEVMAAPVYQGPLSLLEWWP
jgi:hypothetical protein